MANTNKKTAKHLSLINKKKQCKVCGEYGTYQKTLFCYEHFKIHSSRKTIPKFDRLFILFLIYQGIQHFYGFSPLACKLLFQEIS